MKTKGNLPKNPIYENYRIIEYFKSRKNQVFLVEDQNSSGKDRYVIKSFQTHNADKERRYLTLLRNGNVHVPMILYSDAQTIMMDYLGDTTFLDRFEILEKNNQSGETEISLLLDYFDEFYQTSEGMIIWDTNLRNFMIHDGYVWGIDFEDMQMGEKEVDFGRLLAYCVSYTPYFTEWKVDFLLRLLNKLMERFFVNKQMMCEVMIEELYQIELRRDCKFQQSDIEKILF